MQDRQITVMQLADRVGVGKEAARKILATDLQKRKICSKFVPRSLTAEQRKRRVECCRRVIEFGDQDHDVLQRNVIGYKSWCFQFDPETKRRSMEWRGTNSPRQEKVRLQKASVKTMQNFFSLPMLPAELSTASLFLQAPIVNKHYYLGGMERLLAHAPCQKPAVPKQHV
jgi:hypothetical protein